MAAREATGRSGGAAEHVPAEQMAAGDAGAQQSVAARGPRNRYLDLLRAIALVRVVTYHSFDGGITTFFSYVFPAMGVMFAIGGSLMVVSLDRYPVRRVLWRRMKRLLPPLWLLGVLGVPVMIAVGWQATTWDSQPLEWWRLLFWFFPILNPPGSDWGVPMTEVLWYIRTYLWLVLMSPGLLWLFRRYPLPVLVVPFAVLLGYATGHLYYFDEWGQIGSGIVDFCVFAGCWMLGFAHRDGLIAKLRVSSVVTVSMAMLAAGALWALAHPSDDVYDLNDIPMAQALWSFGFVIVLLRLMTDAHWLARVRPLDWFVSAMNSRAVTVYLWHQLAIAATFPIMDYLGLWDYVPVLVQLTITWLLLFGAVVAFGWVEDLGAGRKPALIPDISTHGIPGVHRRSRRDRTGAGSAASAASAAASRADP